MKPRSATLAVALLLASCATWTDELRPVHDAAVGGRAEEAVSLLNARIAEADHEDVVLLRLERGTLLQSLGDYRASAKDLGFADSNLEVLDLSREKSIDLGRYLYSDSAVDYRAPTYERVLLNVVNMVNYLALGDYEGARVEARRFRVFEEFVTKTDGREALPGTLALGNYLSAIAFEVSADYETAARHYARAFDLGMRGGDLRDRLVAILRATGVRLPDETGADLEAVKAEAAAGGRLPTEQYAREWVDGHVIAVVQTGWAPYKVPERISLAEVFFWVGVAGSQEAGRVAELVAEGIVKWINFPVPVTTGLPAPTTPTLYVDGAVLGGSVGSDVSRAMLAEYERTKGTMMLAALTRLLTRVAAGQATKAVVGEATEKKGRKSDGGDVAAWLAGLAVEATLSALDKPDTRGWTMLPGDVRVFRTRLPPGEHRVSASVRGGGEERTFTMTDRGHAVLNFSAVR